MRAARTFSELVAAGILAIGDGYRAKNDELGGDGPIFMRAGKLTDSGFDWSSPERFRSHLADRVASKLGRPGDTVITTKGNSLGRMGFIPIVAPAFVYSPHLSYWRSLDHEQLAPGFLRYWAQGEEFRTQLRALAHGTDMAPYLSLRDQQRLSITMPPIHEQRAIAASLGALDDKIESNRRAIETARALMHAHWAAVDKRLVKASNVLKPVLGGTPKREVESYWGGAIRWASAKDVAAAVGGFVLETTETITDAGVRNSAAKVLPAGTVVMTARGTVGALARLSEPMAFNQSCYGLTSDTIDPALLMVALESAVSRIQNAGHGTVFNTVNMATFDEIELELPAPGTIDDELGVLSDFVLQRLRESASVVKLRDTLLPELLSGRTRVLEARDHARDGGA